MNAGLLAVAAVIVVATVAFTVWARVVYVRQRPVFLTVTRKDHGNA